jgi:hypothetical protein
MRFDAPIEQNPYQSPPPFQLSTHEKKPTAFAVGFDFWLEAGVSQRRA